MLYILIYNRFWKHKLLMDSASNLLILSHDQDHFLDLMTILKNYLSSEQHSKQIKNEQDTLFIKNKYYRVTVKVLNDHWNKVNQSDKYVKLDNQTQQEENNVQKNNTDINLNNQPQVQQSKQNNLKNDQQKKVDFLIMFIDSRRDEHVSYEAIDSIIEKYNPEEFMILLDAIDTEEKWRFEEVILDKCDNFIEIVKQDISKIKKDPPKWARGCLLNEEEYDSGIFSLLDRMETTRWSTLVNNTKEKKKVIDTFNQKQKAQQQLPEKQNMQNQQIVVNDSKKQQIQEKQNQLHQQKNQQVSETQQEGNQTKQEQQVEVSEEQLQKQMAQFQSMMGEMLAFKAQANSLPNQQRKNQAESLFSKMFSNMNF